MNISENTNIDIVVKNIDIIYFVANKFSTPVTLMKIERNTVRPGGTAFTL